LVAGASKYSVFGASDWLKDIRSVDVRQIPTGSSRIIFTTKGICSCAGCSFRFCFC
jgi:hypothetical protein